MRRSDGSNDERAASPVHSLDPAYAALLRRHLEMENAHRMAETLATLRPDCVFDDRALRRVYRGHEGAARYYRLWWEGFGATVAVDHRHVVRPDLVVVESRWSGVHTGPFLGIAPTGRTISVEIAMFVDLADGLMAGERFYWDLHGLLEQLGASHAVIPGA